MQKKYIICDYARADWGKTETLLEVISILKSNPHYILIHEKTNTGKDKWCHFAVKDEDKDKEVVISTLGDPYSAQPLWLKDAAETKAPIIVTASRTKGSTVNVVYDIARKYDYEVIWFQNFHFDNPILIKQVQMSTVRNLEAECIVKVIEQL